MYFITESLFTTLKKFTYELILLSITGIIFVSSFVMYRIEDQKKETPSIIEDSLPKNNITHNSNSVYVAIAGAVTKPDVYIVPKGTRFKEVLNRAGGITSMADAIFFARNFNSAKIVGDEEKYYIPTQEEVREGLFIDSPQIYENSLNYNTIVEPQNSKISINNGSLQDLISLTGIGKVTAEKIISSRPYQRLEELIEKNIIKPQMLYSLSNYIDL